MRNIKLDTAQISRRHFLGGAAGLTFAISVGPNGGWLVSDAAAKATEYAIGAWVRITPDNQLTIITPAAEMGQGSMTGVPIALAEELDVDWSTVTIAMAPADPMSIADMGETNPAAGVIATRPTTEAIADPVRDGLPLRHVSMLVQTATAAAADNMVVTTASAAIPSAASAEPALKPNQPNHSSDAPSTTNGTLCAASVVSRLLEPRGPRMAAATSAATPRLT